VLATGDNPWTKMRAQYEHATPVREENDWGVRSFSAGSRPRLAASHPLRGLYGEWCPAWRRAPAGGVAVLATAFDT
jgi:hypothetical protein